MVQLFPTQVGGPTANAVKWKWFFLAAVFFEALMAICAVIEFFNLPSGICMGIAVFVASVAWKENYNITYICWFGFLSFVGFWLGLVMAFSGFIFSISALVTKFNIPFSCFLGCLVSWWYFEDYEKTHQSDDMLGYTCRQLGLLPPKGDMSEKARNAVAGLATNNAPSSSFGGLAALGGFGMAGAMGAGALGSSSVPVSWTKHWNELRDNEQRALLQLGYTEDTWENSSPQRFEKTPWDRLTKDQQNALRVFQWSPAAWDMSLSGSQAVDQGKQALHGAYGSLGSLGDIAGAKQGNKDVVRDPFMTGV